MSEAVDERQRPVVEFIRAVVSDERVDLVGASQAFLDISRGDATHTLDVDFGETSRWGVPHYFEQQLEFFNRWLPDDAPGHPADEAPVKIFVKGANQWRDEREWPLKRTQWQKLYLRENGGLDATPPAPHETMIGPGRVATAAPSPTT